MRSPNSAPRADPERDTIRVDGEPIRAERVRYWLMHKPRDVLTTARDERATRGGRRTVMELLPPEAREERVFPVGRLDAESEGLLLLTNDGDVAHALLHPSLGTEKEYRVTVRGHLDEAAAERLANGIALDDGSDGTVHGVATSLRRRAAADDADPHGP